MTDWSARHEELAKHLSFFVPPGFLLMKQEEIDRIHNEAEALRIERDAARSAALCPSCGASPRKDPNDA